MARLALPRTTLPLFFALLAGLALLPLTACAPPAEPLVPVTIRFAFPEPDEPYYTPLIQAFQEAHPAITVELQPQPVFEQWVRTPEDTDVLSLDAALLARFRDDLLPLDPFIENDPSFDLADFFPGSASLFVQEGERIAILAGLDMGVMYYNRDLFDRQGLAYPQIGWTWADFVDRAIALSDPDAGIYGYTTTPDYADVIIFVYRHGGRLVDSLQDPSQVTFDDPLTIEAIERFADLFQVYHVAPNSLEALRAWGGSRYAPYQGIRSGMVGMWVLSLSDRGGMMWPVEWDMNWGMVTLPVDTTPVAPVWAEGYAISAQTEAPEACWQWLAFLSRQMHHRLVPPRRSLVESDAYEQLVGEEMARTVRASLEEAMPYSPLVWQRADQLSTDFEAFGNAIEDIIEGRADPRQAMEQAQQEAEQS